MNAPATITAPQLDDPNVRLVVQGQGIEAQTTFGSTWLREDQLAAALGFRLVSTFSHTVEMAGLYRGGRKTGQVLTERGWLDMRLYSLNGATQVCLFLQAHRDGDKASRARELLTLLQMLRTPRTGGDA